MNQELLDWASELSPEVVGAHDAKELIANPALDVVDPKGVVRMPHDFHTARVENITGSVTPKSKRVRRVAKNSMRYASVLPRPLTVETRGIAHGT
ncbi:hypothetical protein P0Y35_06845 [Kiritimatiellaeota bacterium B1221]|nr:hypothetical protein [Kiritimatiellaeota bacterium B1221]